MGTVLYVRPDDGEHERIADGATLHRAATPPAAADALDAVDSLAVAVVERFDDGTAVEAIETVRDRRPGLPVICCSDAPDGEFAAAATRAGATEYYARETAEEPLTDRVASYLDDHSGRSRTVDDRASPAAPARYESIIEAVDDAVYELDDEGQFVLVNDAMTELTGYSREELLGEHTAIVKDDRTVERAEQALRDMLRGDDAETTFELQLQPKSGEPVTCEDHMVMLTDDGAFDGTAGVIRDITDRKERERELGRARERFAELLDTSRALLGARSREAAAEVVVEATAETLGYDRNLLRLYDPETDRLRAVVSSEGPITPDDRPTYGPGEGGPGTAFERGETLRYPDDFEQDLDVPESVAEALYVPLGEQGVLVLGATESGSFDATDRSMTEILASNAAVALDRVEYESELAQYRTVLENVQDMVYVADDAGQFSLVTEPLADWLGTERADLVGTDLGTVLADDADDDALVAAADESGGNHRLEATFVTAGGERLPGEVEVSPLPADAGFAGSVGVVRDRSDLVEARRKLQTQRDRFTYLFDNLPDAVVEASVDESDRPVVRAVNREFVDVFGDDAGAVVGESLYEFVQPPPGEDGDRPIDERTAAGEVVQAEVRRRSADGYRDFLFRGVPYDTSGSTVSGFGIYTDITAQKSRQRRLEVLNRLLRHNLRNDLNVVTGYAEMIADRASDDDVREWAETLLAKASEVTTLSERVRSLDHTVGRGSARDSTVALADLVETTVDDYRDRATVHVDVDDVTVVGDDRLTLALSELLDNSVRYGGTGARVRVATERDDGQVRLRVADDGPGIPDTERIVADDSATITQLEHGSGLGLWVVKWVCESCGGRLSFEESPLGGAAVVLSLPLADR